MIPEIKKKYITITVVALSHTGILHMGDGHWPSKHSSGKVEQNAERWMEFGWLH